jgi:hypothetical protein
MALFKNLYLDFSYLNPFKKNNPDSSSAVYSQQMPVQNNIPSVMQSAAMQNRPVFSNQPAMQSQPIINQKQFQNNAIASSASGSLAKPQSNSAPVSVNNIRELPAVSKRLFSENKPAEKKAELKLPQELKAAKPVMPPPIISTQIIKEKQAEISPVIPQKIISVPKPIAEHRPQAADSSFFSGLYSHISKEENFMRSNTPRDVLYKNLFEEMREFWKDKKDDLNKEVMNRAVKEDVAKKIDELQGMEVEWQRLQLQHDRLKDELASKEILIENNIRYLKKTFKKMHLNAEIKPEHHFILSSGEKLENLSELVEGLKKMDDTVYDYHVSSTKNDFANWVGDVMGLKDLSQNIKSAKTKYQMSDFIDNWMNSP